MESAIVGDKGSTTLGKNGNTKLENNSLCRCQDYSMIDGLYDNTRIAKGGTPLPHPLPRVRKHERIIHHHINIYDDWYRLIKATGKFVGSDNKSADYHLEMGYDNLYNITSKKLTMTQTNLQFAGKLSAGHEFNYNYSNDNPMQLASVETKQYNVDGDVSDVDAKLADNQHVQNYEFDDNGNMVSVSVAPKEQQNSEVAEQKDVLKSFLWDEENRLLAVNNNGSVSCYFYDAAGERTVKLTSESEMVHVNGKKVGGNANISKFTAYVSPYFVVSNGGAYTKHIYAASQRIASKLGNEDGFGADPRRVEMAGGKKYSDNQSGTIKARFEALDIDYSDGNGKKDDEEYEPTMDSEEPENLVFFYHPDHLGSTSYVTDADGNIAQHVEYIPYGEVFVEERNNSFSTNYLFNAKELDNETGLYYYGARYLDPTGAMWLSVDPMWEKYAGMSPYNYCMGNPVKLVDPDGREATSEFEKWLQQAENYAAKKLKDPSISDKERREYESVFTEAKKMRDSDQLYHVAYDDLSKSEYKRYGDKNDYPALTLYKPNFKYKGVTRGCVIVMMNNVEEEKYDPVHGYYKRDVGRLHDFAHEAKHCYQFEMGFHSFNSKGYSGLLYDLTDEIEAHYRGFVFGAENEMPNSSYYRNDLDKNSRDLDDLNRCEQFFYMYDKQRNTDYFRYNGETFNPNRAR